MSRIRALAALLVLPLYAVTAPLAAPKPAAQRTVMPFEVTEASAGDLQRAMTAGQVTSTQLVDSYLARIAAYDHAGPSINAMLRLNSRARAEAVALDAERKAGKVRGPMHGIPIVLKDNYDTKDMITSAGSLALANHRPKSDAFVVAKLREAGAIIIGKTNLHELASGITSISSLGGQTLNPYDLSRCPGGSSGGTGAAVTASFAPIGWGTDTCGSIRIPAAFASLFGLRPTQGLYSRDGIVPLSFTQDTPGPLARTVSDLALGLDITAGADPNDPQTQLSARRPKVSFRDSLRADALRGARIGIFRPYFRDAEADIADTVRSAINAMRALGATVVEVNMPDFDEAISGSRAILLDTRFDLIDYLNRPGDAPVKNLREIIDKGLFDRQLEARHRSADTAQSRTSEGHTRMLARQAQLRARMIAFMDSLKLDAIAYPSIGQRPVLVGAPQLASNCALSSQSGLPAIAMPAGFTSDGLPTALELLGRPWADVRLVAFAFAYEQGGRRRRTPPSTPPLVNGKAPALVTFTVNAGPVASTASGQFTFNQTTSELSYRMRVTGARAATVQAVVVRRADAAGVGATALGQRRVINRALGPGMASGTGTIRLLGDDLTAFLAGRLSLAVFGDSGADPIAEVQISAPR
ncbi:MAG: amidase family protein [Gemmatimonadetes bacterium]|nr:amidase family protein [Gemmatimonadota bacterium]